MLILVYLFVFKVVASPELRVATHKRMGGFKQVVFEEAVAGLRYLRYLLLSYSSIDTVPLFIYSHGYYTMGEMPKATAWIQVAVAAAAAIWLPIITGILY